MKWIVTANKHDCRIYDYHHKNPETLNLIKEIEHPENKLKAIDLVTDKPGRYKTNHSNRGTYTPSADPGLVNIDNFAREIAHELDSARNRHDFDELIVIMSPDMEGHLNHHLNKQVSSLIKHNIQKNLMHLNQRELLAYLHKNLYRI